MCADAYVRIPCVPRHAHKSGDQVFSIRWLSRRYSRRTAPLPAYGRRLTSPRALAKLVSAIEEDAEPALAAIPGDVSLELGTTVNIRLRREVRGNASTQGQRKTTTPRIISPTTAVHAAMRSHRTQVGIESPLSCIRSPTHPHAALCV